MTVHIVAIDVSNTYLVAAEGETEEEAVAWAKANRDKLYLDDPSFESEELVRHMDPSERATIGSDELTYMVEEGPILR